MSTESQFEFTFLHYNSTGEIIFPYYVITLRTPATLDRRTDHILRIKVDGIIRMRHIHTNTKCGKGICCPNPLEIITCKKYELKIF